MKPLTESQMEKIWKDNSVDTLNPIHKKQFMNYLFGEEYQPLASVSSSVK